MEGGGDKTHKAGSGMIWSQLCIRGGGDKLAQGLARC